MKHIQYTCIVTDGQTEHEQEKKTFMCLPVYNESISETDNEATIQTEQTM